MSKKMEQAAQAVSNKSVKIRTRRPGEKVNVTTLEKLETVMEREELVVTLENTATGEDEEMIFRFPTPGEQSLISGRLTSARVVRELIETNGDVAKINVSDEELAETLETAFNPLGHFDRMVTTLAICAVEPLGVDVERVRKWDPDWVETIYVELMNRRNAPTPVDGFHQVGEPTGERAGSATGSENGGEE